MVLGERLGATWASDDGWLADGAAPIKPGGMMVNSVGMGKLGLYTTGCCWGTAALKGACVGRTLTDFMEDCGRGRVPGHECGPSSSSSESLMFITCLEGG